MTERPCTIRSARGMSSSPDATSFAWRPLWRPSNCPHAERWRSCAWVNAPRVAAGRRRGSVWQLISRASCPVRGMEMGAVFDLAGAALRHAIAGGAVALALAACSPSGTTSSAAASAPSFAPTESSTTAAPTPAPTPASTPAWPFGQPVPATLAGDWYFPLRSSTITLSGTDYRVVQTAPSNTAHGNVVVAGDEIDFFNGSGCGVPLPNGVGRYRWTIQGTSPCTSPRSMTTPAGGARSCETPPGRGPHSFGKRRSKHRTGSPSGPTAANAKSSAGRWHASRSTGSRCWRSGWSQPSLKSWLREGCRPSPRPVAFDRQAPPWRTRARRWESQRRHSSCGSWRRIFRSPRASIRRTSRGGPDLRVADPRAARWTA